MYNQAGTNSNTTPGRKIYLILDAKSTVLKEPYFAFAATHDKIARAQSSSKVKYLKNIGWVLKSKFESDNLIELETGIREEEIQGSISGSLRRVTKKAYRSSEKPIYSTSTPFGHSFYMKNPTPDWSYSVFSKLHGDPESSDTASGANESQVDAVAIIPKECIYLSETPDTVDRQLMFTYLQKESDRVQLASGISLTFVGPPSSTVTWTGTGYYHLALDHSFGWSRLFEWGTDLTDSTDKWKKVFNFYIKTTDFRKDNWIAIHKINSRDVSCLIFKGAVSDKMPESLSTNLPSLSSGTENTSDATYYIPQITHNSPLVETPNEVHIRKDMIAYFGLYKGGYIDEGWVHCDNFSVHPSFSSTENDIVLRWFGEYPSGTSIEGYLYNAITGEELTVGVSGPSNKTYLIDSKSQHVNYFRASFKLTTTETEETPRFIGYEVSRNEVIYTQDFEEQEIELYKADISLTSQGWNADSVQGRLVFDLLGYEAAEIQDRLNRRGSIPYRLETTLGFIDKRVVLSSGFIEKIDRARKPWYKSLRRRSTYICDLVGVVKKLKEQFTTYRIIPLYEDGTPFSVVDYLTRIFNAGGIPNDHLDLVDNGITLFINNPDEKLVLNPGTPVWDTLLWHIENYLPEYLWYDENAHALEVDPDHPNYGSSDIAYGKFRLKSPLQSSEYGNPLVKFVYEDDTKLPLPNKFYEDVDGIPKANILKKTLREWIKPPEFNHIVVSAVGETVVTSNKSVRTKGLVNPYSYPFDDSGRAVPDHPDFLGRIVSRFLPMPALARGDAETQDNAVNFVLFRNYDIGAHAIKYVNFTAPLILIPHPDVSGEYRPLKFYDEVFLNGDTVLVRGLNIHIRKSFEQWATYEVQYPRI